MTCQSLPQLQNRYPNNLWAELIGNADTHLMLGCTDDVSADFFSIRSGDMTVEVNSTMTTRQSIALAQVIPQYRYTEGIGRRRVLTPDEVLRIPNDELLIIIRGQKVLRAKKFDFTEHPYAKDCRKVSIADFVPSRNAQQDKVTVVPVPEPIPTPTPPEKATKPPSKSKSVQEQVPKPKPKPQPKPMETGKQMEAEKIKAESELAKPKPKSKPSEGKPVPESSETREPTQQAAPKPARRTKTLYESAKPPAEF